MESTMHSVSIEETHQGSFLLEKLFSQREKHNYCDVIFKVHDKDYPAHRNVLAACSPYFDSIFNGKINENSTDVTLNVACKDPCVFESMLNYLYSGKIEITYEACEELLKLATTYSIHRLREHCSELLWKNMSISNLYHIKDVAETYSLSQLAKLADSFEIANIQKIIENGEILEFSLSKIGAFLGHKSMPLSAEQKLRLICKWVQHKLSEREIVIQELFQHIDFRQLQVEYIYSVIMQTSLFSQSDWCMYHVLQTLKMRGVLDECVFDKQLQKLKEKIPQLRGKATFRGNDLLQITLGKPHKEERADVKPCVGNLPYMGDFLPCDEPPSRKIMEESPSWDKLIEETFIPRNKSAPVSKGCSIALEDPDVDVGDDIGINDDGDDNDDASMDTSLVTDEAENMKDSYDNFSRLLDNCPGEIVKEKTELVNFGSNVEGDEKIDTDVHGIEQQKCSESSIKSINKRRRKGIPVKVHKLSSANDSKPAKRSKAASKSLALKTKTLKHRNKTTSSIVNVKIPDRGWISSPADDSGSDYVPSLEDHERNIKLSIKKIKKKKVPTATLR